MQTPGDRLRLAREAAGFYSGAEAARAFRGINPSTLNSNENGHRDISRKMAAVYAEAFGVEAGWILYGESGSRAGPGQSYSKEVLISVARELSEEGVLPPNDDHDTVVKAFLELCDEHAQRLRKQRKPLELLKSHQ
jgi:transcriptional regulator with XRE-family HTH domain